MAGNLAICPILFVTEWIPGFDDRPNDPPASVDGNILDKLVIGWAQGLKGPTKNIVLIEKIVPFE